METSEQTWDDLLLWWAREHGEGESFALPDLGEFTVSELSTFFDESGTLTISELEWLIWSSMEDLEFDFDVQ